ncbi:Protein serine/threonine phosphatase PrpC, regulation of stationary phase [Serinicoccus hydrothermalis]|uniref:Protein serine/threonine phosphatase PrpC, regulation of stationary phase n=1 Tax=Serinicoccus hydrothermalis TaxID=1758689 RepID=A0A1B1NCS4_9MICO|nr:protein phosphatase 2C domain-containing protein [Serinicoccus hydrothermalis]ANS79232.1 Protein serine/threonine phosphatase PrpC, regulation of stationary phase [Serinicoccus hydrothermalis]
MALALRYAARTNIGLGSKARNEDSAYAGPELLVLCDGMGGHAAGDVASSLVVGELVHLDGESHGADDALDILEQALGEANNRLADVMEVYPDSDGMGTTCIAMLRVDTKLAVANIGDSRAYLLRGGRLTQITTDHSFVQKLLDEGRISQEEAQHHPQRSLVTRVFTGRPEDHPDLSLRELRDGDRVLICSDGLTDYVSTEVVTEILAEPDRTPGQVADALVHTALRASTRDNVTVVVADAVSPGEGTSKPQVVGAASERRGNRPLSHLSPAEKAAALTREASGVSTVDEAPLLAEEQSRPWVRALRLAGITVAVLAVLVAGGWAGWTWSQQQYYVGEQDGMVTIYRGISQDLGPISLSTAEQQTDLPVEELPYYYQRRVQGTLSADGQDGAERIVEDLRALVAAPCVPTVLLPDGSTTTQIPDDMETVTADSLAEAQRSASEQDPGPARALLQDSLELGGSTLGGTDATRPGTEPTGAEDAAPTATVVWPEGCP